MNLLVRIAIYYLKNIVKIIMMILADGNVLFFQII